MANSEIDILNCRQEVEVVSLQVVTFQCGICLEKYEVELLKGDVKMVACQKCENASHQMVLGTE